MERLKWLLIKEEMIVWRGIRNFKLLIMKMLKQVILFFLFIFSSSCAWGQSVTRDSLLKRKEELQRELDSLTKLLNNCSDFKLQPKKKSDSGQSSRTYIRSCRHSFAYLLLDVNSAFAYIHRGEGPKRLSKGKWTIDSSNILTLTPSESETIKFQKQATKLRKESFLLIKDTMYFGYNKETLVILNSKEEMEAFKMGNR
jgi:hypothetical protein